MIRAWPQVERCQRKEQQRFNVLAFEDCGKSTNVYRMSWHHDLRGGMVHLSSTNMTEV